MEMTSVSRLRPYDALSTFLKWYVETRPPVQIPVDGVSWYEGLVGVVLYRAGQFQVQRFVLQPGIEVPDHRHPHVDSYEIAEWGLEFRHSGQIVLPLRVKEKRSLVPLCIRVNAVDWHGGRAGARGGTFLSVQQWRGILPSSVGNDWEGLQGEQDNPAHLYEVSHV